VLAQVLTRTTTTQTVKHIMIITHWPPFLSHLPLQKRGGGGRLTKVCIPSQDNHSKNVNRCGEPLSNTRQDGTVVNPQRGHCSKSFAAGVPVACGKFTKRMNDCTSDHTGELLYCGPLRLLPGLLLI